ncbi:MAG: hypothetical protein CMJ64_02705 [Planctomycetaceae bacterium]|nr:hypothetical protein [Planctomycetaceae bacterium]
MASTTQERHSADVIGSRPDVSPLNHWLNPAADLIFPGSCCLCGAAFATGRGEAFKASLCEDCTDDLTGFDARACPRCARPLPRGSGTTASDCPNCRNKRLHFDRAIALGVYGGRLREVVLQMKRATGELVALALGQLLAQRIREDLGELPDVVAPVPTHWSRRLGRDVNCTDLLVEAVTDQLVMPAKTQVLRCRRRTQKQGTLLPTERRENVRGAYAVRPLSHLEGQTVLVIDDVMTTGATADEVAKVLRKVGVTGVLVAVVARGIGFDG